MDKIFKNEFRIERKAATALMTIGIVFLMLAIAVFNEISNKTKTIVTDQAVTYINNIGKLNRDAVSRSIDNRSLLLKVLSERISNKGLTDINAIFDEIKGFREAYDFYEIGVVDSNLVFHSIDGANFDASMYPQIREAWDTDFHISKSFLPISGKDYMVNMLSYPIIVNKNLKYILVANYLSINLTDRMNTASMYKKDYNFIISRDGTMAIYPKHYDDPDYNSLMEYINDNSDIIPDESGNTTFEYNGEKYYTRFEYLDINDWYLMTCAREDDVFADSNTLTAFSIIGNALLLLIILTSLFIVSYSTYRARKSTIQSVFYDELLGIGNDKAVPIYFDHMKENDNENEHLYLSTFDINKFKEFNYIYGEHHGNELLKYITRVFHEELPKTKLFRLNSDSFVALAYHTDDYSYMDCMQQILDRFHADIDKGIVQSFDISVGIRIAKSDETFRSVLSDALIAKGTVKGIHLKHYAFYNDAFKYQRLNYMAMESGFTQALRRGEFHVYYQPKYDMRKGTIIGAEALVRWIDSEGKIISPGDFIPCFEASRQIILLDQFMLEQVCKQMKEMEEAGLPIKRVSVNLSRVHMRHRDLLPQISEIIKSSGIDPHMLAFEITESALYEDSIPLKSIVDYLHSLGCRVDMDDYGVGVSGLRALAANDFDTIKLDKSFIDGIGDQRMEAVIQSTINLSQTLGMHIIAEGVEELNQAELLVDWGCYAAQGFYYSRPVPEKAYRKLLALVK